MATNTRSTTRKKATTAAASPSRKGSRAAKTAKAVKAARAIPAGAVTSKAPASSTRASKGGYVRPLVYAPIGAGQLVMEKAREVPDVVGQMASDPRGRMIRMYRDLADRGERVVFGVRRSAATRRAVGQAGSARSRVKAAVTSVGRAVEATAAATRNAARNIG